MSSRGQTVVVTFADRFALDTADKWFVACILVFVICFPLYLVARNSTAGGGG